MIRRILLCSAFAVGSVAAVRAQAPPVVTARAVLAANGVHAGAEAQAAVVATIAPGYHINDHHPSLDYLIPTEVNLDPSPKVNVVKFVYPKGHRRSFAFSDTQLSVYEGRMEVGAVLKVARGTSPGEITLTGKFTYQACNDHACLPPASVPVSLTLRVVAPRVALKREHPEIFDRIKFD